MTQHEMHPKHLQKCSVTKKSTHVHQHIENAIATHNKSNHVAAMSHFPCVMLFTAVSVHNND